jgi:hypothetical protein
MHHIWSKKLKMKQKGKPHLIFLFIGAYCSQKEGKNEKNNKLQINKMRI